MTRLCYEIFGMLDSQSFTNCRLVCSEWKEFIDEKFYNLPHGRKWIAQKLTSNFLNEKYNPKIDEFTYETEMPVQEILMDEKNIFVHFDGGEIFAYNSNSFEFIWSLETCREQHDSIWADGRLTLCMSKDRLFAANIKVVGDKDEGFIYMIGIILEWLSKSRTKNSVSPLNHIKLVQYILRHFYYTIMQK